MKAWQASATSYRTQALSRVDRRRHRHQNLPRNLDSERFLPMAQFRVANLRLFHVFKLPYLRAIPNS